MPVFIDTNVLVYARDASDIGKRAIAAAWMEHLRIDQPIVEAAWRMEDRYGLSFWDSLIVAGAQAAGCQALLTEDLQHELEIGGLRVADPFQTTVGSLS